MLVYQRVKSALAEEGAFQRGLSQESKQEKAPSNPNTSIYGHLRDAAEHNSVHSLTSLSQTSPLMKEHSAEPYG